MANKEKLTIKDITQQYIIPTLSSTSYRYKFFIDAGAYEKATQVKNLKAGRINAIVETTESDITLLGGGIQAVAMNITISFVIPVESVPTDGDYTIVENFRDELSDVFSNTSRISLTANGKTYVGAVVVGLPLAGELEQRQIIGSSIIYTCYMEIAYLENAINSADVQFFLNGQSIPYTTFSLSRKSALNANLYSSSEFGEAQTYADSSTFGVNMTIPSIDPNTLLGSMLARYLMNEEDVNRTYTLRIRRAGLDYEQTVIIGEITEAGESVENVSSQISFVPYIEAEDEIEG